MTGKGILIAAMLTAGAMLSGCSPMDTQTATLETHLNPRDKAMMALAPPEEWSIPIVRNRIADPTGEAPGTNRLEIAGDRGRVVLEGNRLVFDRKRLAEIFEFDYALEMYKPAAQRIWVITEWDRSVTTVLLPQDY